VLIKIHLIEFIWILTIIYANFCIFSVVDGITVTSIRQSSDYRE